MTANDKLKRLHHEFDGLLDINTNGEYWDGRGLKRV